ncbi:MAG TPA: hypothetical protein VF310_10985, partial [Vicinamibacteria bacterium]
MSCSGLLPKLDAAVFADTGWEPQTVYRHLDWLRERAAEADIPLHTVGGRSLRLDLEDAFSARDKHRYQAMIPLHVKNKGAPKGLLRREC